MLTNLTSSKSRDARNSMITNIRLASYSRDASKKQDCQEKKRCQPHRLPVVVAPFSRDASNISRVTSKIIRDARESMVANNIRMDASNGLAQR
jgi:hypothetical protein